MRRRLSALYRNILTNVKTSLRTQLMLTFLVCLGLAAIAGMATTVFLEDTFATPHEEIDSGLDILEIDTQHLAEEVELIAERHLDDEVLRKEEIQRALDNGEQSTSGQTANFRIIDEAGKVLLKSTSAQWAPVDLQYLLRTSMELRADRRANRLGSSQHYVLAAPMEYEGRDAYMICEGIPSTRVYYVQDFSMIGSVAFLVAFLILFYMITKRKTGYIEELAHGLQVISKGQLDHRVQQKGEDELGTLAQSINHMAQELQTKIEAEREAERARNELITSVSHDLRTPLTSIIGYLRLLNDDRAKTPEEMRDYLRVAFGKSEQLQRLVEDLFDYTTLSHHDVRLHTQRVSLNEMIEQIAEEYVPLMEESGLQLQKELPPRELFAEVDPETWFRVFENLLSNAIKYSHQPSTVILRLKQREGGAVILLENESDAIPKEQLERLFERFYRVEASRSTKSGGSGLGLAIAKSIVELHGGNIWATSSGNSIQFQIWLPLAK
ncbi:HAMP domain-containing protein [Tumebacillus sp. BK434]|uniref:sensor histidine kinase n=1 Tax=Tumebacillus sp. BK434 TaxID=2512169 RepID=UPI001044FD91|nr:ATP-binding protein [Tumebacillus sp. BK434]TCP59095.1 HAMP domain-containing protein [Tumebacillus sp. BK434]